MSNVEKLIDSRVAPLVVFHTEYHHIQGDNGLKYVTNECPQDFELLAAGPITKQPSSVPYRIVLVRKHDSQGGAKFIVYNEGFHTLPKAGEKIDRSGYANGSYFQAGEFPSAMREFTQRLERHNDYLLSLYREETVAQAS